MSATATPHTPRTLEESTAQAFDTLRKPISFIIGALIVVVVLFTNAAMSEATHIFLDISGIALTVAAAFGRVWCAIYIAGHKNSMLCMDGPYSLTRNPLYFFSFVGLVGLMIFAHLVLFTIISAAIFLIYYHFVIRSEEFRLRRIFGDSYANYQAFTPRFWPAGRYTSRDSITIEPARILKAMSEIIWFLLLLGALEAVEGLQGAGVLPILYTWKF